MKRTITITVLALTLALAGNAALPHQAEVAPYRQVAVQQVMNAQVEHRTAQRFAGQSAAAVPRKQVPENSAYYLRPEGTMYAAWLKDGSGLSAPFIYTKPYDTVTWRNRSTRQGTPQWSYWLNEPGTGYGHQYTSNDNDLTVTYEYICWSVPTLTVAGYPFALGGNSSAISVVAVPESKEFSGAATNYLCSAHYYGNVDRFGKKQRYGWTYYTGAQGPDGEGDVNGYWFGKNYSGFNVFGAGFDAPVSPYLVNKVYFFCTNIVVTNNVDLEVKIYRYLRDGWHRELPWYNDTLSVRVDPTELLDNNLIATGRATITTSMNEDGDAILEFPLYETDPSGGEQETSIEIDEPIIVLITGMDQEAIQSITGLVTTDTEDEGVGELAYLGRQTGDAIELYGLNNFFSTQTGAMACKAGASILLDVSRPFLTFGRLNEEGEYVFPAEGGVMTRTDGEETIDGISFFTTKSSADWTVSLRGGRPLPEWLHITLTDMVDENGNWRYGVQAHVTADARNGDTSVRDVVVRFAFKGAYLDYVFTQAGDAHVHPTLTGDADGNNVIDIDDVNIVINIMLQKASRLDYPGADTDGNDEVDVDDLNYIINYIIGRS